MARSVVQKGAALHADNGLPKEVFISIGAAEHHSVQPYQPTGALRGLVARYWVLRWREYSLHPAGATPTAQTTRRCTSLWNLVG